MIEIQFPKHAFKIRKETQKELIFDEVRKQWFTLTPEEWVRQNFLQYLMVKGYPSSLIAVEKEIKLGELRKRFDIVVFKNAQPWMLIECKEMNVDLTEAVLTQILNYNIVLNVKYLVVTNGKSTYALELNGNKHEWITTIPNFDS